MSDWREVTGHQNLELAAKMLEQQGEIKALRAERDEARAERDALLEVRDAMRRVVDAADAYCRNSERSGSDLMAGVLAHRAVKGRLWGAVAAYRGHRAAVDSLQEAPQTAPSAPQGDQDVEVVAQDPNGATDTGALDAAIEAAAEALWHWKDHAFRCPVYDERRDDARGCDCAVRAKAEAAVRAAAPLIAAPIEAERDALHQHILDIDAHATPYGDIPDEPGWVGVYLLTAGALHRALGKIGHSAPNCEAEAQRDYWQARHELDQQAIERMLFVTQAATAFYRDPLHRNWKALGAALDAIQDAAAPFIPVSPSQRAEIEAEALRERDEALAEVGIRDRSIKSLMDELLRLVDDVKELRRQRAEIEAEALLAAAEAWSRAALGRSGVFYDWLRARAASVNTEVRS